MALVNSNLKISMYWGDILYDTAICRENETLTIGRGAQNRFILDLNQNGQPGRDVFKLVEVHAGSSAELQFEDHFSGFVRLGSQMLSLHAAKSTPQVQREGASGYRVRLGRNDRADVVIGHVSFALDWVDSKPALPSSPVLSRKGTVVALLGLLFLSAVVVTLQFVEPPVPEKPPERLVQLESRRRRSPPAETAVPSTEAPSKAAMGKEKTADGGAQKGPAGKAETKPPEEASAVRSLRKANLGSMVSGLTSLGANAPNKDSNANAVQAPVQQQGTGGFTSEGLKTGGGGTTVGIGRTLGQGEGGFSGTGRLGLTGNSAIEGTGSGSGGGATKVAGGLDRDVIESIIRKRIDRIRLCYERQLNFFPKLAGKVTVHFVIGPTGNVLQSDATEDTMKNASVKTCILAEVRSWNFPAPEGGTLVNVDYPFVFESSNKK